MDQLDITADAIVDGLLEISMNEPVALLDSCGVAHLGSHLLIAGIEPLRTYWFRDDDPAKVLREFDAIATDPAVASIFTISYDFGKKLLDIGTVKGSNEPDIYLQAFESLIVHDYRTGRTSVQGNRGRANQIAEKLINAASKNIRSPKSVQSSAVASNFSKSDYLTRIEKIKSEIRRGNTYQTNLTQRLTVATSAGITPQSVFYDLRKSHPAAFGAFIARGTDHVISISPERFISIGPESAGKKRSISSSPIKGTRRRGGDKESDELLRQDLLASGKDRAENTMIVDLIRNDLGRVCEYGSVKVEQLCGLEEHPTLFHLVSTVSGKLRESIGIPEVLEAVFPCGSITGCPKISTMQIIDELETVPRGLSMGAIGYSGFDNSFDFNVAIRTMTFKDRDAVFNVGGGVVIDSDPEAEYRESLLKAKALLSALNADL